MNELAESLGQHGGSYVATLFMGAVLAYLGLFTVLRRIVFTGVALAQLAAAGVAVGFFVADSSFVPMAVRRFAGAWGASLGSVVASLLGALGLATRLRGRRHSPDALVGVVFAGASALAVLAVWRSARGLAELRNILAGEVLLSRPEELFLLAFGLVAVVLVHLKLRRSFWLVAFDPEFARSLGLPVRRLELVLLGSLALAIALSLRAAGLMLVFGYLLLPPLSGLALGKRLAAAGWFAAAAAGTATLVGFLFAIRLDLPVAATVVAVAVLLRLICLLGKVALLGSIVRLVVLAGGFLAVVAAVVVFPDPGAQPKGMAPRTAHVHGPQPKTSAVGPGRNQLLNEALGRLESESDADARLAAVADLAELEDSRALDGLLRALLDPSAEVRAEVERALIQLHEVFSFVVPRRLDEILAGDDAELRVLASIALQAAGDERGPRLLVEALSDEEVPPFTKDELILPRLRAMAGQTFGYDPFGEEAANQAALEEWRAWAGQPSEQN